MGKVKNIVQEVTEAAAHAMGQSLENNLFRVPVKQNREPVNKLKAARQEVKWLKAKKKCKACGHREIFHYYDSDYGLECLVCEGGCQCE